MGNLISKILPLILIGAVSQAAVQTVPFVDLSKYVGTWYEVAAIPQSFQKQCVSNVTADYTLLDNGLIKVMNSCEKKDGTRSVSEGRAKVVDLVSSAKLKVTFVKFIDWIFAFGGDYWVIDLEGNYNYAVVGSPSVKYGWILARQPSLAPADLEIIERNLRQQGYDTCKFIMTVQTGGNQQPQPLCKVIENK